MKVLVEVIPFAVVGDAPQTWMVSHLGQSQALLAAWPASLWSENETVSSQLRSLS